MNDWPTGYEPTLLDLNKALRRRGYQIFVRVGDPDVTVWFPQLSLPLNAHWGGGGRRPE